MSSVPKSDDQRHGAPHDETIASGSASGVGSRSAGSGSVKSASGFSLHPSLHEASKAAQTVEEFSHYLTASGLMSVDELHSFCETMNGRDSMTDADAFAAILIKANKLTPYQAESIRQGHTRGLVLGNYVILEKLGEGGMGMVFKARHRLMKRIVALKVLPPSMTESTDAVLRFHREVEVAARLTHPNIASAHDADEADGIHFLVMEHVEGPNLSALVKAVGPLSPPVAMNIVAQAARGLAHAHEHGVVHRDIKPGNLLISKDGVVKILDMGLAQLQSSEQNSEAKAELTQSGRIMGTVDYMAPEQALDAKSVDSRADIYSLGCTLFYLIAGRPLSPEGTLTQKLLWHQTETVPTLQSVSPNVPDGLEEIYAKMVAKQPDGRQASMQEVVAQLEPLLARIPPEQLQLPAGVGLSTETGSSTDATATRGKLTMVERGTRTDMAAGMVDSHRPAPTPLPARGGIGRFLPWAIGLGLGGMAVGVGLFVFLAGPKDDKQPGGKIAAGTEPKLIVQSTEPNARVIIDNKEQGSTDGAEPYTLELLLKAGEYRIRVEKDGFKPYEHKITLAAGKPLTLKAPLGARPALVDIVSDIPGVQVSVDSRAQGAPIGKGPFRLALTLDPGEHLVRYEAAGYEVKEEKLKVASGEKFETAVKLAERPFRRLLDWAFKAADKDGSAPVMVVDNSGIVTTAKGWSELPAGYREIREINLAKGAIKNEELELLSKAETLQSLSLAGTPISDAGMVHVALLKNLEKLNLDKTDISDKSLAYLPRIIKLRELDLQRTKITDLGLESLAELQQLETLRISQTMIGDEGVKKLVGVKTLRTLSVDGTRVTEDGYNALDKAFETNPIVKSELDPELGLARRLLRGGAAIEVVPAVSSAEEPKLYADVDDLPREKFHVTGILAKGSRDVNDEVMPQLKGLTRLAKIDLDGSAVTDVGVAYLKQMPTLTSVNLGYLRLAKSSVDSVRQAFPEGKIEWQGPRDRVVAEWVIKQGGVVRISASPSKLARAQADLPDNKDFRLEEIHLGKKVAGDFAVIKDLTDLQLINLVGAEATDAVLDGVTGCPNVRTLAVSGSKITGDALAFIAERFPKLERLYVADSAVDGQGLHQLKKLPELAQLSLAGTNIVDEDLEPLAALPNLIWLSLDGTPLQDNAIKHLSALKKLKMLSLDDQRLGKTDLMMDTALMPEIPQRSGIQITDAGLEDLHKALDSTIIHHRPLDAERLAARWVLEQGGTVVATVDGKEEVKVDKLGALPRTACHVRQVALRNSPKVKTDELAAKLRVCGELRALDLSGLEVGDKQLTSLGALASLEALNLTETNVTDGAFEKLGALPNLRILNLQGCFVSGLGLGKNPLPKLTHLYAGTTDFSDQTIKAIKDCPDLVVLDLSNCKNVTDRGIAELAGLTKLEELNLGLTRITDGAGATIARFKQLKRLSLSGLTGVTDNLVAQLKDMNQLEEVNLVRTKVGDSSLAHLGAMPGMQRISIYGTSVTDGGAKPLLDRGIKVNKSTDPAQRDQNSGSNFGS